MGKNQSASNLTNIIQYNNGNITFVSGSTTLMQISSSGAITTTGVISGSNALSASNALTASSADAFSVRGNTTIGNNSSSFLVVNSLINSNFFPAGDGTYNLGNNYGQQWNEVYANTYYGALAGNANSATSASFAATASLATNATTASSADNFLARGTITAQTLVVQTITSSQNFVTGSTKFGLLSINTHQFTGSMSVSGGLTVVGAGAFNTTVTVPQLLLRNDSDSEFVNIGQSSGNQKQLLIGSTYASNLFYIQGIQQNVGYNQNIILQSFGGNVGIGTSVASTRLHVSGTTGGVFEVDGAAAINALYVSASGQVGIGTTNIEGTLHIVSASVGGIGAKFIIDNSATSTVGNTAELAFLTDAGASGNGNRNGRILVVNDTAGNGAANMQFHTWDGVTSAERVRISNNGNVGINTTSPNSILDVRMSSAQGVLIGGGATTASLQHGIDGNSRYLMISGPSGGANNNYGAVWVVNNTTESTGALMGGYFFGQLVSGKSGTNAGSKAAISGFTAGSGGSVGGFGGELRFYTKPDNAPSDIGQYERMRITSTGLIGINTTTPFNFGAGSGMLDVRSQNTSAVAGVFIGNSDGSARIVNYINNAAGAFVGTSTNHYLDIGTNDTYRIRILSGGNIGIGTTNPGVSLDLGSRTDAVRLPNGTTAQRPTAAAGLIRYNTSLAELEMSNGSNWGSLQTKVVLGSSPSNPAESANEIKTYYSNATNGFYWIRQTGSTATSAYCVFRDATGAEIAGGPWTVPIISNDANSNFSGNGVSAASTFLSKCQAIGINTPGRGMESSRTTTEVYGAWLAVKRTIWEAYTPFVANGNTSGGSVLRMPMININGEGGASAHRLIYNTSLSTHIPPNESGDRCDASQLFCGWWSATDISGWRTNDNNVPGPEDWGPSDNSNAAYNGAGVQSTLTVCVYK